MSLSIRLSRKKQGPFPSGENVFRHPSDDGFIASKVFLTRAEEDDSKTDCQQENNEEEGLNSILVQGIFSMIHGGEIALGKKQVRKKDIRVSSEEMSHETSHRLKSPEASEPR